MNAQVIALVNQKGGVGKSTSCVNLGVGLAQAGKKILLVDCDPQASLTISLGHPQPDTLPVTLSDVMGKVLNDQPIAPGEGILHHAEGVDLMPSDIQLSGMEVSLVNAMSRETILRQYLDTVRKQYTHILLDCQPSLGIMMVDTNIQRENIPPMEKAKALKMKMEAIRRQGARTDLTSPNNSAKSRSDDEIGAEIGMSGDTVRNMISLTQLVPELQEMVNEQKIKLTPAYQLAALKLEEQAFLVETIESEQATPSVSQAQRMKKLSQSGELNEDTMLGIMSEEKKPEVDKIMFTSDTLRKYFPRSYTPRQMQDTITKLLDQWLKKRQRQQERYGGAGGRWGQGKLQAGVRPWLTCPV